MKKFLKVEVHEVDEDHTSCRIEMGGSFVDLSAMAAEAMYQINKQMNEAAPTGAIKNVFWNAVVSAVGQMLLEESVK